MVDHQVLTYPCTSSGQGPETQTQDIVSYHCERRPAACYTAHQRHIRQRIIRITFKQNYKY